MDWQTYKDIAHSYRHRIWIAVKALPLLALLCLTLIAEPEASAYSFIIACFYGGWFFTEPHKWAVSHRYEIWLIEDKKRVIDFMIEHQIEHELEFQKYISMRFVQKVSIQRLSDVLLLKLAFPPSMVLTSV